MFESLYPNLFHYIDAVNALRKAFGESEINLREPLLEDEIEKLYQKIDNDLSPENLHCDGEINRASAESKRQYLVSCWKELEKLTNTSRELQA